MIDYSKAKTSVFIPEQLPSFVRKEGEMFIEFLKTYYDWLERRVVMITLKALNPIANTQISSGQLISSESYILESEDGMLLISEDAAEDSVYPDNMALMFNGVDQYMTVANSCVVMDSDWTIGCWYNLSNYPSLLLHDSDLITLSNSSNAALIKISMADNQVHGHFGSTTIDTGFQTSIGRWEFLVVRYNNTLKKIYYDTFNEQGHNNYSSTLDLTFVPTSFTTTPSWDTSSSRSIVINPNPGILSNRSISVNTVKPYLSSNYRSITISAKPVISDGRFISFGGYNFQTSSDNRGITIRTKPDIISNRFLTINVGVPAHISDYRSIKISGKGAVSSSTRTAIIYPVAPHLNQLTVGFNGYTVNNFYDGKVDNLSVWSSILSDDEIVSVYNDGTPINLQEEQNNYTSNTYLTDLWQFETGNTSIALNSINDNNFGTLIHSPTYFYNTPINISALISEYETSLNLLINTLSFIRLDGGSNGVMSDRMLLFAEHIYGKIIAGLTLYSAPDNEIIIGKFEEAKNPLNIINNIDNYQDIDYNMNYNNFVSDESFQNLIKEIMPDFPLFLNPNFDLSIKDLIGKTIRDFYQSKGTLESIRYLFKLLYNEDLVIGDTLYSDSPYSYIIKTKYSSSSELPILIKNLVHPIGYKVTITYPS